jgi:hypothetical protein
MTKRKAADFAQSSFLRRDIMFTRTQRRPLPFRPTLDALEDRTVPTTLLALDGPQHFIVFDSATPRTITAQAAITGLASGDAVTSLAFRPATDGLYALGVGNGSARIYTIDTGTGAAALVSPAAGFPLAFGTTERANIAFDPVADQIRLVGTNIVRNESENLRINPATGTVAGTDTPLTFPDTTPAGFLPQIVALAYDRAAAGATATTLFAVEAGDPSFLVPPPTLVTVGSVNGTPNAASTGIVTAVNTLFFNSDFYALAIAPGAAAGTEVGYAVFTGRPDPRHAPQGQGPTLTTINLTTGAEGPIDFVGNGILVHALVAVPPGVPLPSGGTPPSGGGGGGSGSPSPSPPANLTASQRYVSDVFVALLGRDPDQASLTAFAGLLDAGVSRLQFVLGVQQSPEYYAHTVDSLYRKVLGRAADPAAVQAGSLFLAAGGTAAELKALLYGSPEYSQKAGGTDAGFLAALFLDVAGQPPDAATDTVLTGLLGAGVSRTGLALALLRTPAAGVEQARRFFADFLGRLPGAVEAAAHAGVVLGAGPELDLALILASDEFFSLGGKVG